MGYPGGALNAERVIRIGVGMLMMHYLPARFRTAITLHGETELMRYFAQEIRLCRSGCFRERDPVRATIRERLL